MTRRILNLTDRGNTLLTKSGKLQHIARNQTSAKEAARKKKNLTDYENLLGFL